MSIFEGIRLTHFASYLPKDVVSNEDILLSMDVSTSPEVLYRAVGSRLKRAAKKYEMGSDMMAKVGAALLSESGLSTNQIEKLICSCDPIDQAAPDASVIVQNKLGLGCPSFGISMSCVGWLCAVKVACGLIKSGDGPTLVLASSTVGSKFKFNSPMHRAIFGDGAGGVLIQKNITHGATILALDLYTIGAYFSDIYAPLRWSDVPNDIPEEFKAFFFMNNDNQVFFDALDRYIKPFFYKTLASSKLQIGDISKFIIHQASMPIFRHTVKSFGIPEEKVFNHYEQFGNTIAAELPIYTDLGLRDGSIKPGDNIFYLTYGAGFTAGAMILRF